MIITMKAAARGMITPSVMGRVVLSRELVDRSQGPLVSLGPHDVFVGVELAVVDEESRGISDGTRSSRKPSSRMSGMGPGRA